jgi:hypothetical protein
MRELLMAWNPPHGVEIRHHFHYVSGGGVLIVESDVAGALYESLEPFKPYVDYHVEPVINMVEALAIQLDVEEWVESVKSVAGNADAWRSNAG